MLTNFSLDFIICLYLFILYTLHAMILKSLYVLNKKVYVMFTIILIDLNND